MPDLGAITPKMRGKKGIVYTGIETLDHSEKRNPENVIFGTPGFPILIFFGFALSLFLLEQIG